LEFDKSIGRNFFKYAILGLGIYSYCKGIDGFSEMATRYTIQKELNEEKARSNNDVKNCLDGIRNFKLSDDYYKRKNDPNYNSINVDSLLLKLKSKKAFCLKGNYGILFYRQ